MLQTVKQWQLESSFPSQDEYAIGLQTLRTKLQRTLANCHVKQVDCVGKAVDPQQMRIVEAIRSSNCPPGTVVEQLRPGYIWKDKVLRHAEVKVVEE